MACLTHELTHVSDPPLSLALASICTAMRLEPGRRRALRLIPPSLPDRQVPDDAGGPQRRPTEPPTEWSAHKCLLCQVYKPRCDSSVARASANDASERVMCGSCGLSDRGSCGEMSHVARKASQKRWQLMHCSVSNK